MIRFVRRTPSTAGRPGFTLIELLVVTVVIGILAALLLPALARVRARAAGVEEQRKPKLEQQQPKPVGATNVADLLQYNEPAPVIESMQMDVTLRSSYRREGMGVLAFYEAHCKGRLGLRPPAGADTVALVIPFPEGASEVRNARLLLSRTPGQTPSAVSDALFHKTGIYWKGAPASGNPIEAEFEFTALGRERYVQSLPPARKRENVQIRLQLENVQAPIIPEDALQPTRTEQGTLEWSYDSIVTDLPLVVAIPGSASPLGRLTLLFQLVGVAVFLFGLGFWYLSELDRPGQLDTFRWGHFLLLALTFSLYFVLFGVLTAQGLGVAPAVLISALFSLPLLVLHVARILNLRFALTRVLPLALFALGLVTNGVYGGAARDYIFLAAALAVMAFLILTYPAWLRGRIEYHRQRRATLEAKVQDLEAHMRTGLVAAAWELRGVLRETEWLMKQRVGFRGGEARERLEKAREAAIDVLKQVNEDALAQRVTRLTDSPEGQFAPQQRANDLQVQIERGEQLVRARLAELRQVMQEMRESGAPAGEDKGEYCPACGMPGPVGEYCPHCGARRPLTVPCPGCGATFLVPRHLLSQEPGPTPLHCPECGTPTPLPENARQT